MGVSVDKGFVFCLLSTKMGVFVDRIPDQVGDDSLYIDPRSEPGMSVSSWPAATGHLYSVFKASAGSAVVAFQLLTTTTPTVTASTASSARANTHQCIGQRCAKVAR